MLWSLHGLRTPHDFAFKSQNPQSLARCSAHQRTPHSGPLRRALLRSDSTMALRTSGPATQRAPGRRSLSQPAQAMVRSSDAGGTAGLVARRSSCGDFENGERLPLRCSFAATRAAPAARRARF